MTSIGSHAFSGCSDLTSVTLNSNTIASATYTSSSNLKNIFGSQVTNYVLGDSVTSIGSYAFSGCSGLTSVTIPNSVTYIGSRAFYGCSGLTSVTLNSNTIASSSNLKNIFGNQVTNYVLGDSVTSIGSYAFYECSGLTSVTIPNSVTSIGANAFYGCSGLTSVTIPNSVTSIGVGAFQNCSGLTSVTIPNSVTSIGGSAFRHCSSLTSVNIPNSVTSIEGSAFRDCYGLTSVTISTSVTSIGDCAFFSCSNLTSVTLNSNTIASATYTDTYSLKNIFGNQVTNYVLGDSVTSIGDYTFYECSGLTSVTVPNSVTSIGSCAFYDCSGLTSLTIPNSVTSIGGGAFNGCSGLTSVYYTGGIAQWCGITFGSVKSNPLCYAQNLYINNSLVTNLIIPNTVTSIGNFAFYNCSGPTSVTIPNSVTSIGDYAFRNCSGLTSIISMAQVPPTLGTGVFNNVPHNIPVYVPYGSLAAYQSASGWSSFTNYIGICSIAVEANPIEGGTVTGAGIYNQGTTATLTATPNTEYVFINWTNNGNVVSTNANYTFTIMETGTYVANFGIEYVITAEVNPAESGTITGAGTYYQGTTATLVATPVTGYHFVNWTENGDAVSTDATYSFTVTGARTLVANFEINSYEITVSVNPENTGTATGAGTFNHGASATLVATPAEHYHFVNWTKNGTAVSTNATYTFTVTEAGAYVANFEIDSYSITATANPTAGGTVTGGGTYNYGATATLTATPATGYHFVNWTENGNAVSTDATYSFTVTGARALVANFEINSYEITVSVNPENTGTATGAGTFNHGTSATLVATPAEHYHFVNWTKNGTAVSTNATYTFTVTEAGAYIANFEIDSYEITATANPTDGGTVTGGGTYNYGATATLVATANTGYHFVNWTLNGASVSTNSSITITVAENADYVANFELNSYTITAAADPESGGIIIGAGTYNHGETATLSVTLNENFTFVNWTENGAVVSTDATYSFTVTENRNLVANLQDHTGVGELSAGDFRIYPNPADDIIFIETGMKISRCEIYTETGRLVYIANDCSDRFEINVENLPSGTYIIRFVSDGITHNRRFVKK